MDRAIPGLDERDLRGHMMWLRRLAARLVGPASADDAVQETLLAAVEHPPSLDRDLRPWLARVLANFAHDARRSDVRRRGREADAIQNGVDAPPIADELVERHEAAQVVAGLVSRLREPHRTLVLLRFAEGVAPVDIARRRGLPEGTVRRQLKEAVDQLRAGVAAHYRDDRRDWRLALAPLADVSPDGGVSVWKGVLWMTPKTKIGLAAAAALLLVLLFVVARRTSSDTLGAAPTAVLAAGEQDAGDHARTTSTGRPVIAAAPPPPPQFAAPVAVADPPDCEKQLAGLRAVASARADVSPAVFEAAKPSLATERAAAPIVDRVLESVPGNRPAYHLECRVSICRVGVVTDGEAINAPPAWLRALERNPAFGRVRGENRGARLLSTQTRDALTGRPVVQHWLYFTMPVVAGEEHPLETRAEAERCGERLAALQRALEDERTVETRRRDEESARRRRFATTPTNVELTRRVTDALAPLLAANGDGGGTWDCRGSEDCLWKGPARLVRGIGPRQMGQALAARGGSGEKVIVLIEQDTDDPAAEIEMRVRLLPARGAGPGADVQREHLEDGPPRSPQP